MDAAAELDGSAAPAAAAPKQSATSRALVRRREDALEQDMEEATQLSAALDNSVLSHALEQSAREVSVVGTEGEGEGGPSALLTPAEGDYVLVGSEGLTDLRRGTLPLPPLCLLL